MTSGQEILTGAYSHNKKLTPNRIIVDAAEGVPVINRVLQALFALGARVNREFFGAQADVEYASGGWARPADAEMVYRREVAASGTEVRLVPFDDRGLAGSKPAVYTLGQKYYIAVAASGPLDTDSLRLFYSKKPTAIAGLEENIDALWPEQHNELVMCEVAIYIAMKDGQDVAGLAAQRDRALKLFIASLEHADVGEISRRGPTRAFTSPTLVGGLDAFLAAPSALKLAG